MKFITVFLICWEERGFCHLCNGLMTARPPHEQAARLSCTPCLGSSALPPCESWSGWQERGKWRNQGPVCLAVAYAFCVFTLQWKMNKEFSGKGLEARCWVCWAGVPDTTRCYENVSTVAVYALRFPLFWPWWPWCCSWTYTKYISQISRDKF